MKKIKIGFVGAGRVTIHHIKMLKKLQTKIKIVAICDLIDSKCDEIIKINPKLKIKKFNDYHKMIEDCKPDLVAILTPSGMHYEHAIDIIKKHKITKDLKICSLLFNNKLYYLVPPKYGFAYSCCIIISEIL